jgi:hypothetical protein
LEFQIGFAHSHILLTHDEIDRCILKYIILRDLSIFTTVIDYILVIYDFYAKSPIAFTLSTTPSPCTP